MPVRMKEMNLNIPNYLTAELARRIATGRMSKPDLERIFDVVDIDIDAEVEPAPDFEDLSDTLRLKIQWELDEDTIGLEIKTGAVELEATLMVLGQSQSLHVRISYAAAMKVAVSEWHALAWMGAESKPVWMKIPAGLLDPAVVDAVTGLIAAHAEPE